tara:strand:- start:5945 stop:6343 length:399 start_codon:yes stop_codon:yes gene_type:complete
MARGTKRKSNAEQRPSESLILFYLSQYKNPDNNSIATKWLKKHTVYLSTRNMNTMNKINAKYLLKKIIDANEDDQMFKKRLKELYYFLNEEIKNEIDEINKNVEMNQLQNLFNRMEININVSNLFASKCSLN